MRSSYSPGSKCKAQLRPPTGAELAAGPTSAPWGWVPHMALAHFGKFVLCAFGRDITIRGDSATEAPTMRKYLFATLLTLLPVAVDVWLHYHPVTEELPAPAALYAWR